MFSSVLAICLIFSIRHSSPIGYDCKQIVRRLLSLDARLDFRLSRRHPKQLAAFAAMGPKSLEDWPLVTPGNPLSPLGRDKLVDPVQFGRFYHKIGPSPIGEAGCAGA